MKKIACIVLSAAMVLSLGACGLKGGSGTGAPETAAAAAADGETVAAGVGKDAAGGNSVAEGVGDTDAEGDRGPVVPEAVGVSKGDLKVGFLY